MHYSVQFFTWTPKQGVHQVGSTIEIDAVNPKLAAVSLIGLRLDETGAAKMLAVRVWNTPDDSKADCACFYYHQAIPPPLRDNFAASSNACGRDRPLVFSRI